jgi:predicted HTH domain antitoxin
MLKTIALEIPEEVMISAKIPRNRWKSDLKRELALQLYRESLMSFANAHRLAGMSKIEFHYLLGERQIPRQYDVEDYEKDLENLARWRAAQ